MKCVKCSVELPEGSKYCPVCKKGESKYKAICPYFGLEISSGIAKIKSALGGILLAGFNYQHLFFEGSDGNENIIMRTRSEGENVMQTPQQTKRNLIEGRPALVVVDIQAGTFIEKEERAIAHMPGYAARMAKARDAIDKARTRGIPIIFIQEVHRPNLVDFGRELDGSENIHCLENNPES